MVIWLSLFPVFMLLIAIISTLPSKLIENNALSRLSLIANYIQEFFVHLLILLVVNFMCAWLWRYVVLAKWMIHFPKSGKLS